MITSRRVGSLAPADMRDLTPSGVSRGVSRTEEELGVRLFNRHRLGLS
jgi:DNA-binding transcriptional LysR family regulator